MKGSSEQFVGEEIALKIFAKYSKNMKRKGKERTTNNCILTEK
jgi:hypothetical protein